MLKMLTVREASKYAPEFALRRFLASGELPAVRTGKKWLICESVLIDFLTQGNNKPTELPVQPGQIRRLQ